MPDESSRGNRFNIMPVPRSRRTIVSLLNHVASKDAGLIFADFDLTWSDMLRKEFKRTGKYVTVTAILLKAIAIAQKIHPESRTEWLPFGRRVTYNNIVAGFTVERVINGQPTVLLGEIESPIEKPLEQIAMELKEHAEYAVSDVAPLAQQNLFSFLPTFARSLVLEVSKRVPFLRLACQKATFGLTSLGKFGADSLTCPSLCCCSFSIGTAETRASIVDGKVVSRSAVTVGINFDQRSIDIYTAARILQTVKELMEGDLQEWLPENLVIAPKVEALIPPPPLANSESEERAARAAFIEVMNRQFVSAPPLAGPLPSSTERELVHS